MPSKRLTDQQMAFFDTFGYLFFPGLLADCIDEIIGEFEAIWAIHGAGHHGRPHDSKRRSCIFPFPDQSDYFSSFLDDSRIHDIAASVCATTSIIRAAMAIFMWATRIGIRMGTRRGRF